MRFRDVLVLQSLANVAHESQQMGHPVHLHSARRAKNALAAVLLVFGFVGFWHDEHAPETLVAFGIARGSNERWYYWACANGFFVVLEIFLGKTFKSWLQKRLPTPRRCPVTGRTSHAQQSADEHAPPESEDDKTAGAHPMQSERPSSGKAVSSAHPRHRVPVKTETELSHPRGDEDPDSSGESGQAKATRWTATSVTRLLSIPVCAFLVYWMTYLNALPNMRTPYWAWFMRETYKYDFACGQPVHIAGILISAWAVRDLRRWQDEGKVLDTRCSQ